MISLLVGELGNEITMCFFSFSYAYLEGHRLGCK